MKKKILSLCLVVAMVATAVVGASMAYLTDTEEAVNVMTLGNVQIIQNEQERGETGGLQDFTQNQAIAPAADVTGAKEPITVNGYELQIRTGETYVDKIVSVTNDGVSDAYVRTIFAFPEAGEFDSTVDASEQWFHWNGVSDSDTTLGNGWMWGKDRSEWPGNAAGWDVVENVTIGGKVYDIYVATNMNVLAAGASTAPSLLGFYLDARVDFDGVNYTFTDKNGKEWILGDISKLDILVLSQAVQTAGFSNAWTALDTAFGDVNAENAVKWFEGVGRLPVPADAIKVSDLDGLKTAFTNGGNYEIVGKLEVAENLTVSADTHLYSASSANGLDFSGTTSKITVAANTELGLYGVQMDAGGSFSMGGENGIVIDEATRRTTPLLSAGAGSTLVLDGGTTIENVVAKGSAVISVAGVADSRATVTIENTEITNCAGESGTIINVDKAADVVIGEGTVISGNASYNNNNHGIIRVYNAWDATNPSTVTMNGGEISGNYYSGNGMIGLYYGKMIMNGGSITGNSWFENNENSNGWYPVVYVHSNSQFVMNGGVISGNAVKYGVLNSLNSSVVPAIVINGGSVTNNPATNNDNKDAFAVVVGEGLDSLSVDPSANVTGTVWQYYDANGDRDQTYYDNLEAYFTVNPLDS